MLKPTIWEKDGSIAQTLWQTGKADFPIYDMHAHMGKHFAQFHARCEAPEMIRHAQRIGVKRICFSHYSVLRGPASNSVAADVCRKYPDILRMYVGINPNYPERMRRDLADYDKYLPFAVGLKFLADYHKVKVTDPAYAYALDFASELISAYDVYNTALKKGEIDSSATLSVVDLTMIKPAYEKLQKLFVISKQAIFENSEYYADISLSASKAYGFGNYEQIDLIHYLKILDSVDYENSICQDNACLLAADSVMAAIPYRNRNSAEGIYGMSLTFPIEAISTYTDIYNQLKIFEMNDEMEFYNNFFSIMAAQSDKYRVSNEKWYIEGFEDYETTDTYIDIPLTETEYGYLIDLPEKVRNIIADIQVAVYQKDDGRLRYLGRDYMGVYEEDGRDYIDMDNRWVHINNNLICYEAGQVRETDSGTVYTGETRALLNGRDDIIIHIEWKAVNERTLNLPTGKITGYTYVDEFKSFMSKGMNEFKSGDRLNFYFDYYDMQGNFIETETYGGTLIVTNPDYLTVKDKELKKCDIIFSGVLTDVYQREFLTEQIEYHIN